MMTHCARSYVHKLNFVPSYCSDGDKLKKVSIICVNVEAWSLIVHKKFDFICPISTGLSVVALMTHGSRSLINMLKYAQFIYFRIFRCNLDFRIITDPPKHHRGSCKDVSHDHRGISPCNHQGPLTILEGFCDLSYVTFKILLWCILILDFGPFRFR